VPVAEKPTQTRIYEVVLPDGSFVELKENGRILFRPQWASREVVVYESIKDLLVQLRQTENAFANLLLINTIYHHAHTTWATLDASKESERYDE